MYGHVNSLQTGTKWTLHYNHEKPKFWADSNYIEVEH